MNLQREFPNLLVNTCSPGYVLTDLTAGMGASKTPEQSNCHVAPLHLLFGDDVARAWYPRPSGSLLDGSYSVVAEYQRRGRGAAATRLR